MTLEQRLRALQAEKDALERFAAVAAHELMEPLVMAEACALLLADSLGQYAMGESRTDLDNLLRGASRMRLLVETLLHDARSSGQPLTRAPVDLREVVEESAALLQREIHAHEIDLRIGALPVVPGDATLLGVVVNNLLLNAVRYGPRTGGRIDVRARRASGGWRVVISSDGATVPPEERERIFDPFRRGQHERRVEGTGIGLTICRSIVERHGGSIGVQPKRPQGNRFYFTLPDETPAEEARRGPSLVEPLTSPHQLDRLTP